MSVAGWGEGVGGAQPPILHPFCAHLEVLKEARGGAAFVPGSCSGNMSLRLLVYILMTKPVGLCLSALFISETFLGPGFADSMDIRLLSYSSLCCHPTPYPLSELSTLKQESLRPVSGFHFTSLGVTNCLLIILNAGM